jgi:hypothetical protein
VTGNNEPAPVDGSRNGKSASIRFRTGGVCAAAGLGGKISNNQPNFYSINQQTIESTIKQD